MTLAVLWAPRPLLARDLVPERLPASSKGPAELQIHHIWGGRRGGAELRAPWFDIALPVLAGERRAATLTPVGCCRGEPGWSLKAPNSAGDAAAWRSFSAP